METTTMSGTTEQGGKSNRSPGTLVPSTAEIAGLFEDNDVIPEIAATLKLSKQTLATFDWSPQNANAYGNPTSQLNAFAARRAYRYALIGHFYYELLSEVVDDFKNYVQNDFAKIDPLVLRELKRQLRYGGIHTGRSTQNVAESLAQVAKFEDIPDWPDSRETKSAGHTGKGLKKDNHQLPQHNYSQKPGIGQCNKQCSLEHHPKA